MKRDVKALFTGLALLVLGMYRISRDRNSSNRLRRSPHHRQHALPLAGVVQLASSFARVVGSLRGLSSPLRTILRRKLHSGRLRIFSSGSLVLVDKQGIRPAHVRLGVSLVPWIVAILSGALFLLVGVLRFAVTKLRR